MPLPASIEREELHQRQITMRAFHRVDGLFDVEARLVDTKTVPFIGPLSGTPLAAGEPIHDLWIRLVIDLGSVIHEAVAVSVAERSRCRPPGRHFTQLSQCR